MSSFRRHTLALLPGREREAKENADFNLINTIMPY